MNPTFQLAPDLVLPADTVVRKLAFIGTTDSGKTYNAMKLAEAMWDAGSQFVALDTMGIWYGLRLDGTGKGIPIAVFGGRHGDLPLSPRDGHLMAEVIVREKISAVIDLSAFETDSDKARFASDFADRLYRLKTHNPSAIHLFLEEAHEFIPQNVQANEAEMLHRFNRIWKQGGNFGIGGSIITQRPQDVNKKSSELSACVFAFNTSGTNALEAMQKWIKHPSVAELPNLPIGKEAGKCLVYSPGWLRMTEFRRFDSKRTFHVRFDPTAHQAIDQADRSLAPVAIEKLRDAFAKEIQEVATKDPKLLKDRIKELEGLLAESRAKEGASEQDLDLAYKQGGVRAIALVEAHINEVKTELCGSDRSPEECKKKFATGGVVAPDHRLYLPEPSREIIVQPRPGEKIKVHAAHDLSATQPVGKVTVTVTQHSNGKVGATTPQMIVDAIAFYNSIKVLSPTLQHVGALIGKNPNSGKVRQVFNHVVDSGLARYVAGDRIQLSDGGKSMAKPIRKMSLGELHRMYIDRERDANAKQMLLSVLHRHPRSITIAEMGDQIGKNMNSGKIRGALNSLVDKGLLKLDRDEIAATSFLYPEGLK